MTPSSCCAQPAAVDIHGEFNRGEASVGAGARTAACAQKPGVGRPLETAARRCTAATTSGPKFPPSGTALGQSQPWEVRAWRDPSWARGGDLWRRSLPTRTPTSSPETSCVIHEGADDVKSRFRVFDFRCDGTVAVRQGSPSLAGVSGFCPGLVVGLPGELSRVKRRVLRPSSGTGHRSGDVQYWRSSPWSWVACSQRWRRSTRSMVKSTCPPSVRKPAL